MNELTNPKPDIEIIDTDCFHSTSVNSEVAEKLKVASWDDIHSFGDFGLELIARRVKEKEEERLLQNGVE